MCKAKPPKFIIKLYTGHNTFWVKHTTHQNVESLRPTFLSKLDNIVNNNSIVNTKDAEFSTKWYVFLHFHNFTCVNNQCFNLQWKSILQSIFISLFHPYLFTKSSLQSPLTLPSSISQQFYTSFFVCTTIPTIYTKMFSLPQPLCQFRLPQGTKVLGGLLRTATFFFKVWTGLIITDSLSLRLWKLVYCRCRKPSNPPSLIPSASCHYFHTLITPPQVKQPVA